MSLNTVGFQKLLKCTFSSDWAKKMEFPRILQNSWCWSNQIVQKSTRFSLTIQWKSQWILKWQNTGFRRAKCPWSNEEILGWQWGGYLIAKTFCEFWVGRTVENRLHNYSGRWWNNPLGIKTISWQLYAATDLLCTWIARISLQFPIRRIWKCLEKFD